MPKLNWSISKIGAFVILILGISLAFFIKSEEVGITALAVSGGLLGWKGWNERKFYEKNPTYYSSQSQSD